MPRKGKRRREARRERKEQPRAQEPAPAAAGAQPPQAAPKPQESRIQRPWKEPARRKRKRGGGFSLNPWLVAAPVAVVALAVVGVIFAMGGAGGGSNGAPKPSPTVDPRIRGQTPTAFLSIEAGGGADNAFFKPNSLTVKAKEVFQIEITNTGDVTHNLTLSGLDKEYDTPDDWESVPYDIKAGEKGILTGRIDTPGSYPFRCAFHPTVQFGTLVVQP